MYQQWLYQKIIYAAPQASWVRGFDPCTPLFFNLYHYFEQNGAFGLVPECAPGASSQVFLGPGFDTRLIQDDFSAVYNRIFICVQLHTRI